MKDLMKLLEKKGMDLESDDKKMAKMEVIKELLADMGGMIGDDMDSMQKVTVAADDAEGMEEGLDKAKEIVEMMPEEGMEEVPMEMENELGDYDLKEEDEDELY